jgi:hypothetical protein
MAPEPITMACKFLTPLCVSFLSLRGKTEINMVPRQQIIIGCVVFCAVRVISKTKVGGNYHNLDAAESEMLRQ